MCTSGARVGRNEAVGNHRGVVEVSDVSSEKGQRFDGDGCRQIGTFPLERSTKVRGSRQADATGPSLVGRKRDQRLWAGREDFGRAWQVACKPNIAQV